jgi:hypothetical protein
MMRKVPPLPQALAIGEYREEFNPRVNCHFFTFGGLDATLDFVVSAAGRPKSPIAEVNDQAGTR